MCGELCTTAHTLLRQIDQRVDELQGIAPLRRVLQREMRHLEQFLAAVTAASPAEAEEWRRMRNRLQRIVKELMRLKDIVEGAYRSLSSSGFQKGEPRDRHEAYEVLGDPNMLVEIADWESAEAREAFMQDQEAAAALAPLMELLGAPFKATILKPRSDA